MRFHCGSPILLSYAAWLKQLLNLISLNFHFALLSLCFSSARMGNPIAEISPRFDIKTIFPVMVIPMLTHKGRDKMAAICQTTFSYTFSWMKMNDSQLKISLKFVPKVPINHIPALVQIMTWGRPGDKPLSEPMMVVLPMHICITRPQ